MKCSEKILLTSYWVLTNIYKHHMVGAVSVLCDVNSLYNNTKLLILHYSFHANLFLIPGTLFVKTLKQSEYIYETSIRNMTIQAHLILNELHLLTLNPQNTKDTIKIISNLILPPSSSLSFSLTVYVSVEIDSFLVHSNNKATSIVSHRVLHVFIIRMAE